jgi:hypothetical protein
LKSYRAAIERALPPDSKKRVLIAVKSTSNLAVARARARQLQLTGSQVVLLEVDAESNIHLSATDGSLPQSMELRFLHREAIQSAELDLKRLNPSHLEIVGDDIPRQLIELAMRLDLPVDIWTTSQCSIRLKSMLPGMRSLLAPTAEAFNHARAHIQQGSLQLLQIDSSILVLPNLNSNGPKCLAVIVAAVSPRADLLIRLLLAKSAFRECRYRLIVVGSTFNDAEIMSEPGAFVTGPIESIDDVAAVLAPHNVVALLVGFDVPLFGHPILEAARRSALPVGFVDWSESTSSREMDLAIPTAADDIAMTTSIAEWLEQL